MALNVLAVDADIDFDYEAPPLNPDSMSGLQWRVEQLERRLERLEERKAPTEDVEQLREELRSMRNLLLAFAGSVLSGAVLFALTMVALFGGHA